MSRLEGLDWTGADNWDKPVFSPPFEFDQTAVLIEEIRIQKILDAEGHDPEESGKELLERYRNARAIVQSTPIPEDFDLATEIQLFQN